MDQTGGGGPFDEVLQSYVEQYRLGVDLAASHSGRAIQILAALREMKRLRFNGRKEALMAHRALVKRFEQTRAFYRADHAGYNDCMAMIGKSLEALEGRIRSEMS